MASIRRFQDIDAWRQARELTQAVYKCFGSGTFARDYALQGQMRRAAISVMSNIAEGFERNGSAEFAQHLAIAKGSAGELEAQLYIALDQGYVSRDDFKPLYRLVNSTKKLIGAFCGTYATRSLEDRNSRTVATRATNQPGTPDSGPGTSRG